MHERLNSNDQPDLLSEYRSEFGPVDPPDLDDAQKSTRKFHDGAYPKDTRMAKAYEIALDIRKFEIDLFWKRAGHFWLLLAALAAALGLILTAGNAEVLPQHRREYIALFLS